MWKFIEGYVMRMAVFIKGMYPLEAKELEKR